MGIDDYKYNNVSLGKILHFGVDNSVSGYFDDIVGYATDFEKSRPLPLPYSVEEGGIGKISDIFAAKHDRYTIARRGFAMVNVPSGATKFRYILAGGSGGGGGGGGGASDSYGDNHLIRGFEGRNGAAGQIIYSSDIPIYNNSGVKLFDTVGYKVGPGGSGSSGGEKRDMYDRTTASMPGVKGVDGKQTTLTYGSTTVTAGGGVGGPGGIARGVKGSGWGHGSCYLGASYSGWNVKGWEERENPYRSGWGTTKYGKWHGDSDGNTNKTPATATYAEGVLNNWDNTLNGVNALGNPGTGGNGGWSWNEGSGDGCNDGISGTDGKNGLVTLIWLY